MIIDTNIYAALMKNDSRAVEFLRGVHTIYLPFVVMAELWQGFYQGTRFEQNASALSAFMAQQGVVLLHEDQGTPKVFGELAAYCRKSGHALSEGDLWIAALAKQHQLPLLTFDRDFLALASFFGKQLVVL